MTLASLVLGSMALATLACLVALGRKLILETEGVAVFFAAADAEAAHPEIRL
jgi:hypothetical protein